MKMILIMLFVVAGNASAQIPKELSPRDLFPREVNKDVYKEIYKERDTKENIPMAMPRIKNQDIPGLDIPITARQEPDVMKQIVYQITKCKYDKEVTLAKLKVLENRCTETVTRPYCIQIAREKFLQFLIANCNKPKL